MTVAKLKIELLYLDGCSSWHQTLENLRQALRWEGATFQVFLVRVMGAKQARALKMRGCPSIRLGGQELFPEVSNVSGLTCQLYQTLEGLARCPTVQMIRQRLDELGVLRGGPLTSRT